MSSKHQDIKNHDHPNHDLKHHNHDIKHHDHDIKNVEKDVEKAFSKVEESVEKVQQVLPQRGNETRPKGFQIGFEPFTRMAAWYIDAAEEFAQRNIELQEQAARLMKNTPWGSFLQVQTDISRKMVENSFGIARNLWRLPPPRSAHHI